MSKIFTFRSKILFYRIGLYASLLPALFLFDTKPVDAQDKRASGLHTDSIVHSGITRKYMYYIPNGYAETGRLPVVFFLHGMGASSQIAVNVLGPQYHARSERDRAVVVYPEAVSKHWNDRLGGSYPLTDHVDDVGYISTLIDLFVNEFKGDPSRIYVSGSSNGGMMTYRLSVDIPQKIAAIAPFISAISPEVARQSQSAEPVPIIITSGTADTVIKWTGGRVNPTRTPALLSGDENIKYWIIRNKVADKARIQVLPDIEPGDHSTVEVQTYEGKHEVVLYKIINGAHQHPTLREVGKPLVPGKNMDYNSFETVWDFMMRFRKN